MSTDGGIDEDVVPRCEWTLSRKKNKILPFAATGMNLETGYHTK